MWVEQFIQYIRYEKNYSSHTVFAYKRDIGQFMDFVAGNYPPDCLEQIDADMIRAWMVSLMEGGDTARTVNRKLSALKSYWRFLLQRGLATDNPTRKVLAPKLNKALPVFLKEKEMNALLDEPMPAEEKENEFVRARNHLILEMFCMTGMRRAELIALGLGDVDLSARLLRVHGKRNKQRLIPFGKALENSIRSYLDCRRRYVSQETDAKTFFVKQDGAALYPKWVYRLVHENILRVGTLSKSSPHVLRHTFATTLLNEGAELNAVKELLGHANLSATEVYTHTTFAELKKVYKQAHPRAEK